VDEVRLVWTIRILLYRKKSRIEFGQQAATNTSQPSWKRSDWNTDLPFGCERARVLILDDGRHTKPFDLLAKYPSHRLKKPRLLDGRTTMDFPSIKPHGHDRKVRQIDKSTWAIGPQELAGTYITDNKCVTHAPPPWASSTSRGRQAGPSGRLSVIMISRTPGSTSRIDIGTVN
jgi:hypothetical protein